MVTCYSLQCHMLASSCSSDNLFSLRQTLAGLLLYLGASVQHQSHLRNSEFLDNMQLAPRDSQGRRSSLQHCTCMLHAAPVLHVSRAASPGSTERRGCVILWEDVVAVAFSMQRLFLDLSAVCCNPKSDLQHAMRAFRNDVPAISVG